MGTHEAATGKHTCDYCGKKVTECSDENKDHKCDVCETTMGTHEAAEGKHTCDYCGKKVTECADENKDHKCDTCDATLSQCNDGDKDHNCDLCKAKISDCNDVTTDNDHNCDTCGNTIGECGYDVKNTDEDYRKSVATCTTYAVYYYSCNCGAMGATTFEDTESGYDDTNHNYDETTIPATCTTAGSTVYTCECGNSYTEDIPATGHADADGDWICDNCKEKVQYAYVLVTDINQLGDGKTIIITSSSTNNALGAQTSDYRSSVDVVKSADNKYLLNIGEATIITLVKGTKEGQFAFVIEDNKYLNSTAAKKVGAVEGAYYWTITIENGETNIASTSIENCGYLYFNKANPRFTTYTSSSQTKTNVYVSTLVLESEIPQVYTVTFNSNGGTNIENVSVNKNELVSAPKVPNKTGYTFDGWYSDESLTTSWSFVSDKVTENMTLYAKWTINQYTITFDSDGGTSVDSITADYNAQITKPVDPTRKGYTFAGWDTTIPSTMPAQNMTIKALWTPNSSSSETYSYTFESSQFNSNDQTVTLNNKKWTLTGDGGYLGYDGTKGQQLGSSKAPYESLTLTSDEFTGVTQIIINTSGASSIVGTLKVTVGGNDIGKAITLTQTATAYTFKSDEPLTGEIALTYSQTSSKAIYIKSISVTYTANGESGGETTEPEHTHNTSTINGKTPSCCTPGYKSCYYCASCETYFTDAECTETNKIGDKDAYDEWTRTIGDGFIEATGEHTYNYATDGCTANICSTTCNTCNKCTDPTCEEYGHTDKCNCESTGGGNETNVEFVVPSGVTAVEIGEGNRLPTADAPDGYTFVGWSETTVDETTNKPTILEAGSEYSGTATTLYAVYSRTENTEAFVKVKSTPTDWLGTYLIVYETGKVAFNGDLTSLDAVSNTVSVTLNNGKIAATNDLKKATFTIAKSESNYTIKSASGYYIGQSSNANGLKSDKTTTYANTLSINDNGTVNIISGGAYLRYNKSTNNGLRFRYYKSSSYTNQQAICLYRLETTGTTTYYTTLQ